MEVKRLMSKPPTQYVYVHVIQVTIPVGGVQREDVQIKFVVNFRS